MNAIADPLTWLPQQLTGVFLVATFDLRERVNEATAELQVSKYT